MLRSNLLSNVISILLIPSAACGQQRAAQSSPPGDATIGREIDAYLAPLFPLDLFSGVVLLMRDTVILHERAYGAADLELGVAMRPDHAFRIASLTKSFTRALVGRLADRGALTLDAPLARWLPAYPSAGEITVRMLLDHRAGVPNVNSLAYDEEGLIPNGLAALVDSLAKLPLDFAPGSRRSYSNGGYALLAHIIEQVAQKPYGRALAEEILVPLRLTRTAHVADGTIVPHLAGGYMPSPSEPGQMVHAPFQEMATKTGGGSMVSTARDVAAWMAAIGRSSVLRAGTWRELFPASDSALIFTGRAPGYNSAVIHDRHLGLTAVVLANNYAAGMVADIAAAAVQIARGERVAPLPVSTPVATSAAMLGDVPGRYQPPAGWLGLPPEQMVEVRRVGNDLVVYVGEMPVDVLIAQDGQQFLARTLWSLVSFRPGAAGTGFMEVRALYRDSTITLPRVAP